MNISIVVLNSVQKKRKIWLFKLLSQELTASFVLNKLTTSESHMSITSIMRRRETLMVSAAEGHEVKL